MSRSTPWWRRSTRGCPMAEAGVVTAAAVVAPTARPRPGVVRRLSRDPKVAIAGGFILFLVVAAIAAPLITPHDPLQQNLLLATAPPVGLAEAEPGYWIGTDGLGRDVLSRIIYGTRVSLTVAVVAAGLSALLGP